jgi:cell division protein FtsB
MVNMTKNGKNGLKMRIFAMIRGAFGMRKLSFVVILLIGLLVINNLVRSIYGLWQKRALIEDAKRELSIEKQKYVALSEQMKEVGSPSFLEEEARNKLFLVKPGEEVVIVPREEKKEIYTTKKVKEKAIWEQWLSYFAFSS